ncbi:hypothetical protein CSC94_04310 [Zhengella mangrovi]|uniref:Uncharacterized protein n=1 Tax=Zhengella mangrovi TaxID=1982044 RepID=A0A2G1QR01_9HYPH|nr:hypothetical protein [Zhengella mangrovi]PHP67911.1 hypothetical protein CSC94_04310 [Zhengella mangrovi]
MKPSTFKTSAAAAAWMFSSLAAGAQDLPPACVNDPAKMPVAWQPPALLENLDPAPWSADEDSEAKKAVEAALDQLIGLFRSRPDVIQDIWDDSIESVIQVTYATANHPAIDAKAEQAARENLGTLMEPYLDLPPEEAACIEFRELLPLAIFANRLLPGDDKNRETITERTNAAVADCGTLETAIPVDYQGILQTGASGPADIEDLFDLALWSIWLTEASVNDAIEVPDEADGFAEAAWAYFSSYDFGPARPFTPALRNTDFLKTADLAVHVTQIPTGVRRYPIDIADNPSLYRFLRENFYTLMQMNDFDTFASVVDTLRQYGCGPKNDRQVRDGVRYVLAVYRRTRGDWLRYYLYKLFPDLTESDLARIKLNKAEPTINSYELIHTAWVGMLALRDRHPAEPEAGTYGGAIRAWLPRQ